MGVKYPPESASQASAWDAVKGNALRFGLCETCAGQLAWAHQGRTGGFGSVHPPCTACAPLVATLPKGKANGWRTVSGSANDPRAWPISPVTASGAPWAPGVSPAMVDDAPAGAPVAFQAHPGEMVR